ncbi:MAG: hypothetical protein KKA42_01120, partial [candidate division Zixibacteria bacterium]|nr:hypothetical protein [candidate division Zixibacteria bacterium]
PGGQAWEALENLDPRDRENLILDVVLPPGVSDDASALAGKIEDNWNTGHYDTALLLFSELADLVDPTLIELGQDWRVPLWSESPDKFGGDIRIGVRDSIYATALDVHRASGNLFAITLFQSGASGSAWTVNFSSDGGETWTETYYWNATYQVNDITATVLANHCYVAFTRGLDQDQVLMYRFRVSDGARENFPDATTYQTIFTTTAPEAIEDVELTSNQDYIAYVYRQYLVAITSSDNLKFYWDDETATSWTAYSTGVTDADRGLDVCLNEGSAQNWLFVSYIDNADVLRIAAIDNSSTWLPQFSLPVNSPYRLMTSISAYHDTVHCVFEYSGASQFYVRYEVSYNGGTSWSWGTFADTTIGQEAPAVAARDGGGVGVIWRHYNTIRTGRFTWRDYSGWPWPYPSIYTDNPPYWNQPSIEHIGNGRFGVVYLAWNSPTIRGAYFDRGSGCCIGYRGNVVLDIAGCDYPDQSVDVSDLTNLIDHLFINFTPVCCFEEADLAPAISYGSPDWSIDVGDLTAMIDHLFITFPSLPTCPGAR